MTGNNSNTLSLSGLELGVYQFSLLATASTGFSSTSTVEVVREAIPTNTPSPSPTDTPTETPSPTETASASSSIMVTDVTSVVATPSPNTWETETSSTPSPVAEATSPNPTPSESESASTIVQSPTSAPAFGSPTASPFQHRPKLIIADPLVKAVHPVVEVRLNVSAEDLDGGPIAYRWTQLSGGPLQTDGTTTNSLVVANPSPGLYGFKVVVVDAIGLSAEGFLALEVSEDTPTIPEPVLTIETPYIEVSAPVSVVQLTSTAVGEGLSYRWYQIEGTGVQLQNDTAAAASVLAPPPGFYKFRISVTDTVGQRVSAVVDLLVLPEATEAPTAAQNVWVDAGEDRRIVLPFDSVVEIPEDPGYKVGAISVILEAESNATVGTEMTWVQSEGAAVDMKALGNTTVKVSRLVPGAFVFTFVVKGASSAPIASDSLVVSVHIAPRAEAGDDQVLVLPSDTVMLYGVGKDLDGFIAGYAWDLLDGPSKATLSSRTEATTSASGLVEGDYVFQLKVTDDDELYDMDTVTISVISAPTALEVSAGEDQVLVYPVANFTLSGDPGQVGSDPVQYQWIQVAGPEVVLHGNDTETVVVQSPPLGYYTLEFIVTMLNGSHANTSMSDYVNVAVSTAPEVSVSSDATVRYPNTSAVLRAFASDSDASYLSFSWRQSDSNAAVTMDGAGSSEVTLSDLEEGVYTFELTVYDEYNLSASATVTVTVVGGAPLPCFEWLDLTATGLVTLSSALGVLSSLLGYPGGYILSSFNHVQLVASFSFLQVELPVEVRRYARSLRWSLLNVNLTDQILYDRLGVQDPALTPVVAPEDRVALPAVSQAEYYSGNLFLSVGLFVVALVLHTFFFTCFKVCRRRAVPLVVEFPRLEILVMQLLYLGLALNAAMLLHEARSGLPIADVSLGLRLFLVVLVVCLPFILLIRLVASVGNLVEFGPSSPASPRPKPNDSVDKKSLLDAGATSDEDGGRTEAHWRPAPIPQGRNFLRTHGVLFRRFRQRGLSYLYIPLELFSRLVLAFALGAAVQADGILAPAVQVGIFVFIAVFRLLFLLLARPFISSADNATHVIVAGLELVVVLAVAALFLKAQFPAAATRLSYEMLGLVIAVLSVGILLLLLMDQFRVLVQAIRRLCASGSASAPPPEAPLLKSIHVQPNGAEVEIYAKPVIVRKRTAASVGHKRIAPEEMNDSVFRTSVYLPHLERTFNVFVPELQPISFATRFANYPKGLRRGYVLDIDARTGNVFFWYDSARFAAVIHSDRVKRKIGKLLSRRKDDLLNSWDPSQGRLALWDDPDFAIAGSREACFRDVHDPAFPVYTMEAYKSVCAVDGVYKDGIWRGHPFELVGFEFDEPLRLEHFANGRIAATLDRACNFAKTSSSSFLRVYDMFAVRIPAERPQPARVRVVSVVEPTDCDLDQFLRDHQFIQNAVEFQEIMRGILVQVVIALHCAQTCSFDGRSLGFRHNDLTTLNVALSISPQCRKRLESLQNPPQNPASEGKRYIYWQLAERYIPETRTDPKAYTGPINFVVDLCRVPLVKIVNFAASASRVLDSQGQLSADLIRGQECPSRLPSESYDLRFFAISLFRTLSAYQGHLGPVPPSLLEVLSSMASGNPAEVSAATQISDTPGLFPRHVLDHPYFEPLREQPPRSPVPCLSNTLYYVEHPKDKVIPSTILSLRGSPVS